MKLCCAVAIDSRLFSWLDTLLLAPFRPPLPGPGVQHFPPLPLALPRFPTQGDKGTSTEVQLPSDRYSFDTGETNEFEMSMEDVGKVQSVFLRMEVSARDAWASCQLPVARGKGPVLAAWAEGSVMVWRGWGEQGTVSVGAQRKQQGVEAHHVASYALQPPAFSLQVKGGVPHAEVH